MNGDQEASLFSSNICNLESTLGGPGNCGNSIATWNGSQSSRGSGWEANSCNKVFSVFGWTQESHRLWQWPWQAFSPRTREGKMCLNCCTVNYFMKRWMKKCRQTRWMCPCDSGSSPKRLSLLHLTCYHINAFDGPQSLNVFFNYFSFYVQIAQ